MPHSTDLPSVTIDGHPITVAPLETISYEAVASGNHAEIAKLTKAAKSPGFFYLDVKSEAEGRFLRDVKTLYKLGEDYFSQPEHVKQQSFFADEEKGWKPDGKAQTLEIPRDEPAILPSTLSPHRHLFTSVTKTSHEMSKTLLAALSASLSLPSLPSHHRDDRPSASGLKLDSNPFEANLHDVPFSEHTDMGSLTLLFSDDYTTEVCLPAQVGDGERQWAFVRPRDGCAVVNVADSLQRLSGGVLRSCLHRVGQPVAGAGERLYVLYYLRPGIGGGEEGEEEGGI